MTIPRADDVTGVATDDATDDVAAPGVQPPRKVELVGEPAVVSGPIDTADTLDSGGESSGVSAPEAVEASSGSVVEPKFQFGDVGALPTDSTAYHFDQSVSVVDDEDAIRRIANAVHMGDTLQRADPTQTGLVWSAGEPGTDAAWFSVSATAPYRWSYSAAAAAIASSLASADAVADTIGAEQAARGLVKSIGVDPDALRWKSIPGSMESGRPIALVSAVPPNIPITASDSVSPYLGYEFVCETSADGNVQMVMAQGPLGKPSALGPYPLVDATTAVERLNHHFGEWVMAAQNDSVVPDSGGVPSVPAALPLPVTSTVSRDGGSSPPPATPVMTTTALPTNSSTPSDISPVTTAAGGALPQVKTTLVTLTAVAPDLIPVEATDGTWLLPAYRFTGDDGQWHSVLAVSDDLVTLQASPQPPVTTHPPTATVPPTTAPEGVQVPRALVDAIGLPLSAFEATAAEAGFTVRVVVVDGVDPGRDADWRTDRVNVFVDTREGNANDPIVVGIEGIG